VLFQEPLGKDFEGWPEVRFDVDVPRIDVSPGTVEGTFREISKYFLVRARGRSRPRQRRRSCSASRGTTVALCVFLMTDMIPNVMEK
jgi:hypothetical protein